MKRLFVCNKPNDDCGVCYGRTPHKLDCSCKEGFCPSQAVKVKCIRYRHPLEVAVIKRMADARSKGINWFARDMWRLLKESRK